MRFRKHVWRRVNLAEIMRGRLGYKRTLDHIEKCNTVSLDRYNLLSRPVKITESVHNVFSIRYMQSQKE